MRLGELDDRYLPRAAERLAALVDAVTARADRLAARRRRLRVLARGQGRLRRLDDRYARSGPLALLRDVPQVGFVLIAAVFLAGAGTAVSRENARNRTTQGAGNAAHAPVEVPSGGNILGPEVGTTTSSYEQLASQGLVEAAAGSPDSKRTALISFRDYRTPAQAKALLEGFAVQRVFLRAKAGGKEATQVPVDVAGDLVVVLRRAYAATVRERLAAQKSFQGYVDSIEVTTPEEQAFKDLYVAFAKSTGVEAAEYRRGCACVYAALVRGKAASLAQLQERPGVRVVELAAPGVTLGQLQVLPLLPEVMGVVPKQQASVDSRP